jgi:hypothetical protein
LYDEQIRPLWKEIRDDWQTHERTDNRSRL